MRLVSVIYYQTLVSPGIGALLQTFFYFKELIMEDFPTFGYPMKPTLMCFLSLCKLSNYLSRLIKDPFPKGLFKEAWYASVGYSLLRYLSHLVYKIQMEICKNYAI